MDPICPDILPPLLTEADSIALNSLPLIYEVRKAVFSIEANSFGGPNEFSSLCFQHYWDIIQEVVYNAVIDFFEDGHLAHGFFATSIVLLLKRENACRWIDYRPISLVEYKIELTIAPYYLSSIEWFYPRSPYRE